MRDPRLFELLANAVLILHAAVVLFVVAGLVLIVVGNRRSWRWVNSFWFRLAHLATIGAVAAESWAGFICPLTTLEMWLRAQAGSPNYSGGFIAHWLQAFLYWEAQPWLFTGAYSLFVLAVLVVWWHFPPRSGRRRNR